MANPVRYYFFPPTWDYPPGGPIKLGNIITSLKRPERPIYTAPQTLPIEQAGEVYTTSKENVVISLDKLRSGGISILTKFLGAIVGLGVDVGVTVDNNTEQSYTFPTLTTALFIPTPSYIQSCLASPNSADLVRHLQISRFRKPLYIITGIQSATASTAAGSSSTSRVISTSVGVDVDGTILSGGMAPVGGGPTVSRGSTTRRSVAWEGASDFVFAYRVRRVWVRPVVGGEVEVRKEEDYRKGAFLGGEIGGDGGSGLGVEVDVEIEEEGAGLEGEMERGGFRREEVADDDGGGLVFCGVPVEDEEDED